MKHFFMCLAFQIEYNNHFLLIDFLKFFHDARCSFNLI